MNFIKKIQKYINRHNQQRIFLPSIPSPHPNEFNEEEDIKRQLEKQNEETKAEQQRLEKQLAEERAASIKRLEERKATKWRADEIGVEQKRLDKEQAERLRLEEIRAIERKILERERLKQIHELNRNETYREYLIETEKFRKEFGKNIRCDICSKWEINLHNHHGQTYCEEHIPPDFQREIERKIVASRHDSSKDYIKK